MQHWKDLKTEARSIIHETADDPWWFLRRDNDARMVNVINRLIFIADVRQDKARIAAKCAQDEKARADALERELEEASYRIQSVELDLQSTSDALDQVQGDLERAEASIEALQALNGDV
jgi:septal ring factor EnvC (AmiA/AmiB activator)